MSKSAHKNTSWRNDVNNKSCPKSKCKGKLIVCQVTYKLHGPIHNELECINCGFIKKDPRYKHLDPKFGIFIPRGKPRKNERHST